MRKGILIGTAFIVLTIAGCGGGSGDAVPVDKSDIARRLAESVQESQGARLTDVSCVQRSESVYRCVGDYKASRKTVQNAYRGIDKSDWTDADWNAVIAQQSGSVSFEVTVDLEDGMIIYEPV